MDLALFFSAVLLGLAGAPHCAAMCGAACTAAAPGTVTGAQPAFHLARAAGYAAAGAVAASSVGALALLGQWTPALRPLWTLAHAAALGLGLWLLWHGRQPAWLQALGRQRRDGALPGGWQAMRGPGRAALAGTLWFAWPCGLLQSALVVAALAGGPAGGAAVMGGFALASGGGLALGPWLWSRRLAGPTAGDAVPALAVRGAGALLLLSSSWALGHGLWQRALAFCFG